MKALPLQQLVFVVGAGYSTNFDDVTINTGTQPNAVCATAYTNSSSCYCGETYAQNSTIVHESWHITQQK